MSPLAGLRASNLVNAELLRWNLDMLTSSCGTLSNGTIFSMQSPAAPVLKDFLGTHASTVLPLARNESTASAQVLFHPAALVRATSGPPSPLHPARWIFGRAIVVVGLVATVAWISVLGYWLARLVDVSL